MFLSSFLFSNTPSLIIARTKIHGANSNYYNSNTSIVALIILCYIIFFS